MNDKTLISFVVVFIISVITFISYSTLNSEAFGDELIQEIAFFLKKDTLEVL